MRALVHHRILLLIIALCTALCFIRLGFWQMQRGEYKKKLKTAQSAALLKTPRPLQSDDVPQAYEAIELEGHYERETVFLDNQHWQHRFGYHVLSPFLTIHGQRILIDRGWVEGDPTRRTLPAIVTPELPQKIIGQVWRPALNRWSIGPQMEIKSKRVFVIEQANPMLLNSYFRGGLEPFLIRLDGAAPNGFIRVWAEQTFTPERHYGYAVQWFAMALTVCVLTMVMYRRGTHGKT